jgi:DNA-directed RNA polymerase subunit RPC12/RpoP
MKTKNLAYLFQCACFYCRKSFKRDITSWEVGPKCPDCGSTTHVMGRYFRPPSVRATKQWRKVEMLYQAGIRFSGTQSGELGQFPDTLLEARAFLQRNQATLMARQFRAEHACSKARQDEKRRTEERRRLAQKRKNAQARRLRLAKLK